MLDALRHPIPAQGDRAQMTVHDPYSVTPRKPLTSKPRRIQLKRTKGWKMPENTVKVDRSTKWGNPFVVGATYPGIDDDHNIIGKYLCETQTEAVEWFRDWVMSERFFEDLKEIRGKNLACWCPLTERDGKPVPCHADVLLEIANK
jgi:hypothetical protein